jgi:polyferredoxin
MFVKLNHAEFQQAHSVASNGVWHHSLSARGGLAWLMALALTLFYVLLYWFPHWLGLGSNGNSNSGLIAWFDSLSRLLNGNPASQWFAYGTLYTLFVVVFGVRFILKYRHNRYQVLRTLSVIFFQLGFAFLLPEFLTRLQMPYYDLKNMWPLNYSFFFDWNIKSMLKNGTMGLTMLFWGLALMFLISPVLTYFFGKRWYCSWVCGCGGLAETAGDSFRHLSDKSPVAWRLERILIHIILVFVTIMTIAVLYNWLSLKPPVLFTRGALVGLVTGICLAVAIALWWGRKHWFKEMSDPVFFLALAVTACIAGAVILAHWRNSPDIFGIPARQLKSWYGFFIGSAFSGVIGVGFYPLLGSRVWCRFGCPMAAILGLQQRFFSRFRITTNGGQCISCGNCSVYCEMGIDVRAYAQRGQSIVRAACVGCGICAEVCPRGVLRLENAASDISSRSALNRPLRINHKGVRLQDEI